MEQELDEAIPPHLKLLLNELDAKNITGVKLIRQGNKILLLFNKTLLSRTNQTILNTINAVYPNIIISINDPSNPFDYEELYGSDSEKANKKVRPHTVWSFRFEHHNGTADKFFERFAFAGIELDTSIVSDKKIQFGYFLEFINALQIQDVIGYEDLTILNVDTIHRHEHYIKSGSPDISTNIELWVKYNAELEEYSNALRVSDDPYLYKVCIVDINVGVADFNKISVELTPKRIIQNFEDYYRRKMPVKTDTPQTLSIDKTHHQDDLEIC